MAERINVLMNSQRTKNNGNITFFSANAYMRNYTQRIRRKWIYVIDYRFAGIRYAIIMNTRYNENSVYFSKSKKTIRKLSR